MDSGFGADDGYGVYSKPMFNRGEAQSVYRPKRDDGDAWGDADQQVGSVMQTPWLCPARLVWRACITCCVALGNISTRKDKRHKWRLAAAHK